MILGLILQVPSMHNKVSLTYENLKSSKFTYFFFVQDVKQYSAQLESSCRPYGPFS